MTVTDHEPSRLPRGDATLTPRKAGIEAAAAFAQLAADLAAAPDTNHLLAGVVQFAVRHVACDWATIQLTGQEAATVASDLRFAPANDLGPADEPTGLVQANQTVVTISDTRSDQRWPHWSAHLYGVGVRSVMVVRLGLDRSALGTIAFYAAESRRFCAVDQATARLLAVHAALTITRAQRARALSAAIDSSTLIGQAQGIAMERFGVDGEAAFVLLRRCSQDNNIKLRDVAQSMITNQQLPGRLEVRTAR